MRVIAVLLGWRHWNFNISPLSFLWLVVVERYAKEQRGIIVNNLLQNLLQNLSLLSGHPIPHYADRVV